MRRVSITELKNRLSHYLRLVRRGETIEILDRSTPVARLERIDPSLADTGSVLVRLEQEGIITKARTRPDESLLRKRPVPCRTDPARVVAEQRGDR